MVGTAEHGKTARGICPFCGEPQGGEDDRHGACEAEVAAEMAAFVALVNAAAADDAAAAAALSRIEDGWHREHAAWLEDQRAAGWPDEPF